MVNSLSKQSSVKVLVDAEFLVNSKSNIDRLFSLINSHRQVEVTVIEECLKRACQSNTIEFNSFVSKFPTHGIRVISRNNLTQNQSDTFLANIDYANNYTENFDSQVEIAYARTLGIFIILTDNKKNFSQADHTIHLKLYSIDDLEQSLTENIQPLPITPPTQPPITPPPTPETTPTQPPITTPRLQPLIRIEIIRQFINNNRLWSLLLLLLPVGFYFGLIGVRKLPEIVSDNNYCPLDDNPFIKKFISCGEKTLISEKTASEAFQKYQETAIELFNKPNDNKEKPNYQDAVSNFKSAFQEKNSPETLIYLNNALLEANKTQANTIAISVPITKAEGTATDEDRDLAKEMLRGVAHVQTLVNKCLFPSEFDFLPDSIQSNNILCDEIRKEGKGLRVLIVDDVNKKEQAKNLANKLNQLKDKSILAVIGHNSSDLSNTVIPIYNQNKLVLISPGSSSEIGNLSNSDFFFRTVPSISYDVPSLIQYMKKNNINKICIFYNGDSQFSQPLFDKFKQEFEAIGGTIVKDFVGKDNDSTSFNGENFDFLSALKDSKNADALVLFPDGQTTKSIDNSIDIIKNNQQEQQILGTWSLRSNRILKAAKDNPNVVINNKLVVYSPYHPDTTPNKQYVKEANDLWEDASPNRTATSYDAAWVLVNAFLKTPNLNRETLKDTLNNMGIVKDGATGNITFDENGNRNNLPGFLLKVEKDPTNKETGLKFVPFK